MSPDKTLQGQATREFVTFWLVSVRLVACQEQWIYRMAVNIGGNLIWRLAVETKTHNLIPINFHNIRRCVGWAWGYYSQNIVIILFPYSPAPILLFSQDQPLFPSKFPLFPINICFTVPFLANWWKIVLQFTWFCKTWSDGIRVHSHARIVMLGGEDWGGSSASSWAECMNTCVWLRPHHLYACTWLTECSQISFRIFPEYSLFFEHPIILKLFRE